MSFFDEISKIDLDKFTVIVDSRSDRDVERALSKSGRLDVMDFAALISENARHHYLQEMAQMSVQLTRRRFGRTVSMYLPLYLTNLCSNRCRYCGFSSANKFRRTVLTLDEIQRLRAKSESQLMRVCCPSYSTRRARGGAGVSPEAHVMGGSRAG